VFKHVTDALNERRHQLEAKVASTL